jgi:meso-butanediol dehydrogenase/(S,S)-butanediol dehydrogenase/diacetyl reductase
MAGRLDGRVIVVTGGASGIGAAMCRGFADEGAAVTIADLNNDLAGSLADEINAAGGKALAVAMDVTKREEVKAGIDATVKEFGKLDAFFNNVGG